MTSENDQMYAMDHETRAFLARLAKMGDQPLSATPIAKTRSDQLKSLKAANFVKHPADIEDRMIPGGPQGDVSIRIVRPKHKTGILPAVVYCHGGGWVMSDKHTHDRLIRAIAHGAGVAIVFVNYSRSPEVKFPVANEESFAVLQWVAQKGHTAHLDSNKIAVAGDSVGANMATVLALMAKQHGKIKLAFQLLMCPVLDAAFDTPSYQAFASGYMLSRETMQWCWDQYLPDIALRQQPLATPLNATLEQLQGLPPAGILVAECDILRDEGEAYARKLSAAEVPVTATRYLGTIHSFMASMALGDTLVAKTAIAQANRLLQHHLKTDSAEN